MDFFLTEEQKGVQRLARDFAEREIMPKVSMDDHAHRFQDEIVKKMADYGFFGSVFPENYGGSNLGFVAHAILVEEICRAESSLRHFFNMQALTCPLTILNWGTQDQKKKYIRKLIQCELFGVNAMTEPNAGSDFASIQTTALKDGNSYTVNGSKIWISNAPIMDAGVVYVKTDPKIIPKFRGISCFIIEKDMPGLHRKEIKNKLGHHCAPTGELIFEDCRIPEQNLIGELGNGFKIAMNALDFGRISVAAGAVGVAQACIDESTRYCNEREAFGKRIGEFQMNQQKIADMIAGTEASRILLYKAAFLADQKIRNTFESTIAKHIAAETCVKAARFAVEIFGGYGYSEEYPVARLYRDAIMYQTGEGSSNITSMIIALDGLGWKKVKVEY
ncbi:MAG: acyl-CoA dehydrogenase family protein [Thermodesulfobacteriota bacterium]|nr:acyl-CoA dehydrogenase family protein [Thermodesulfobacteriota bacterium]